MVWKSLKEPGCDASVIKSYVRLVVPRHAILAICACERSILVSAAASIFADVIVPLVSFALEMCIVVLIASIRPWRYLISPAFRAKIKAHYAGKNAAVKWWHLFWGSVLLMASLTVVVGAIWLSSQIASGTKRAPGPRQQAAEKAERATIEKLGQRWGSK